LQGYTVLMSTLSGVCMERREAVSERECCDVKSLLDFFRETCRDLAQSEDPPVYLDDSIEHLRSNLEAAYARYEGEAPEGAEAIREAMLESLDLFCSALDCLEQYLENPNAKLLTLAVENAEEASDILEQVEYIIEQSQQWLSQYSQA